MWFSRQRREPSQPVREVPDSPDGSAGPTAPDPRPGDGAVEPGRPNWDPGSDSTEVAVAKAMSAVPREWFLPSGQRRHAEEDRPLPIGGGQTNSQPSTVATMLGLLEVQPGQRILDVGSGSGWTTALLAWLTGPRGTVLGVELDEDLAAAGAAALARTAQPWARIERARPGVLGAPEQGPFDRILVSAMAKDVPEALVAQLDPHGGVMIVPAAGRMARIRRRDTGTHVDWIGYYRFVPLR